MIWILSAVRISGEARALRFLLLCFCGWIALRSLMAWDFAIPGSLGGGRPPWPMPSRYRAETADPMPPVRSSGPMAARRSSLDAGRAQIALPASTPGPAAHRPAPVLAGGGGFGADRHSLRYAMMARLLGSPQGAAAAAMPERTGLWASMPPTAPAVPASGQPFWIQRSPTDWSISGWVYLREGSGRAPAGVVAGSQLGGSQAGLRLARGIADSGRLRAYVRATMAIDRPAQRELAVGTAFAPVRHLPVDLAIEQRVAAGREGRTALAVMATGGVSEVPLPAGFRLDTYVQAGIVGARRRDGFADGAVVIDHDLGPDGTSPVRLGMVAAGAVQPGVARIDAGPRLTLRLPEVGEGSRIALDWRQRIAGHARPESGLALTLAADF